MTSKLKFPLIYGLGLLPINFAVNAGEDKNMTKTMLVGHEGMDWGSGSLISGYSPEYQYSISIT